jgi:hypothetical protein
MQLAMRNRGSKLLKKYPRLDLRARAKRGFIHGVKRVNKSRGETSGPRCDGLGKLCCDRKVDMRRNESRQRIGRHGCIGRNQSAQRATGRRDPGQKRAAAADLHKDRAAIDATHYMVNRSGGRDGSCVGQQINRGRDSGLGTRGAVHTARATAQPGKADDFRRVAAHRGWLEP